jgi:hypothetical protein
MAPACAAPCEFNVFQAIMHDINNNLAFIGGGIVDNHGMTIEKKVSKAMERLFEFLNNPQNKVLFTQQFCSKEFCEKTLMQMADPKYELYWHLDPAYVSYLSNQAKHTIAVISTY